MQCLHGNARILGLLCNGNLCTYPMSSHVLGIICIYHALYLYLLSHVLVFYTPFYCFNWAPSENTIVIGLPSINTL